MICNKHPFIVQNTTFCTMKGGKREDGKRLIT